MAFRISWTPRAENELAELWLSSRSRQRVTECAARLEDAITTRPLETGESRAGNLRIAFDDDLTCEFYVDDAKNSVVILSIRKHR